MHIVQRVVNFRVLLRVEHLDTCSLVTRGLDLIHRHRLSRSVRILCFLLVLFEYATRVDGSDIATALMIVLIVPGLRVVTSATAHV